MTAQELAPYIKLTEEAEKEEGSLAEGLAVSPEQREESLGLALGHTLRLAA